MRILITGSEGFVGSHIADRLSENPKNMVFGVDNLSKHGIIRKTNNRQNYKFVNIDILRSRYLDVVLDINPNVIIDLASIVGGIKKIGSSDTDMLDNIRLFSQTLQASSLLTELKHFISFSSSIVYQNINTFPTPELDIRDIQIPSSPYGYYKYTCEYLLGNANLPYTIIRLFNCIGINDDNEEYAHVFTDFIRQAKRNKKIKVMGGDQYRSFIDVVDISSFIELLIKDKPNQQTYNLGNPNNNIYISGLAYKIAAQCGLSIPNGDVQMQNNPYSFDLSYMSPNINKVEKKFNWSPKVSLEQSLDECIKYYN